MSFILDALKKSEHKRRAQAGQEPDAIFEPPSPILPVSRRGIIILVALLSLCVLLLTVLVLQPSRDSHVAPERSLSTVAETAFEPAPISSQASLVVSPSAAQRPSEVENSPGFGLEQPAEPNTAVPSSSAVETQGQIYSISNLPADVRRRLPALQMALHAYNAADAAASLVQINGQLVREGAQIAEDLSVDKITHDGAVLRSGSYRFLLPRRQ